MANSRKKISELPALNVASLDTTFVLGISGSTTYKISINNLTSSLDTTFATDLVTATLSNTLDTKLSTSSFNSYTSSFTASVASGTISGSQQISDLGFVTGSYTTINSFNSLTQSFNSISQSFTTISGSVGGIDFSTLATTGSNTFNGNMTLISSSNIILKGPAFEYGGDGISGSGDIIWQDLYGNEMARLWKAADSHRLTVSFTGSHNSYIYGTLLHSLNLKEFGDDHFILTSSFNSYTASQSTSSLVNRLNTIESVSGSWITESETGSFLTSLSGAISSSSQLTSSYDTRYVISGSVGATPSGTISGSSQLTSSFDTRYAASGSVSSNINTASLATTGSNSFNGNQTITGSLVVGSVAVVNGGITVPTGSVISLTSGSSLFVDTSGSITGSLTGSVFGIGDVVAFSASVNSRILSGSAVAGTISGSSQLTSSFDTRYAISASFVSSSNLSSIRTITSASYAALTPVSGTLYIIIG
jgi:hypothetical protein